MEVAELVRDYLDVLKWPLVVVALLALLATTFRKNVGSLIDRTQKARGMGLEIEAPILAPEQEPVRVAATGAEAEGVSDVIQDLTKRYSAKIGELAEETETARRESKSWAGYYYYYQFERIYRLIYGTQIRLMKHLDALVNKTASSGDLSRFFDNHLSQQATIPITAPPPNYDDYLSFLKQSEMIEDAGDQTFKLTVWGEWFLAYIKAAGISEYKPY